MLGKILLFEGGSSSDQELFCGALWSISFKVVLEVRQNTEQSLADFDVSSLLPVHKSFLNEGGDLAFERKSEKGEEETGETPRSLDSGCESEVGASNGATSTWQDLWQRHAIHNEFICRKLYHESMQKSRRKTVSGKKRLKKVKRKLKQLGFSLGSSDRQLVKYVPCLLVHSCVCICNLCSCCISITFCIFKFNDHELNT